MKKSKLYISIFTILIALSAIVQISYAFWDSLNTSSNEDVIIGEGMELAVTETVSVPEGKTLVPEGAILGINDINEIVLEYNCVLNKESVEPLTLFVTYENVKIGGSSDYSDLVNINLSKAYAITGEVTKVIVTITLNEPIDENIYHAIKNQTINFDLNFSVERQTN